MPRCCRNDEKSEPEPRASTLIFRVAGISFLSLSAQEPCNFAQIKEVMSALSQFFFYPRRSCCINRSSPFDDQFVKREETALLPRESALPQRSASCTCPGTGLRHRVIGACRCTDLNFANKCDARVCRHRRHPSDRDRNEVRIRHQRLHHGTALL